MVQPTKANPYIEQYFHRSTGTTLGNSIFKRNWYIGQQTKPPETRAPRVKFLPHKHPLVGLSQVASGKLPQPLRLLKSKTEHHH